MSEETTQDTNTEEETTSKESSETLLTQESEDTTSDDDQKEGAPEEYAEFTLSEGVVVNEAVMGEFTQIAKELNLTQEQAQKLVSLQSEEVVRFGKEQAEQFDKTIEDWKTTSEADTEFGGAKFKESIAVANKAIKTFGNDALRELLDTTGTGNHPEVIRFCYKIGKMLSEDTVHSGTSQSPNTKTHADILFPNQGVN